MKVKKFIVAMIIYIFLILLIINTILKISKKFFYKNDYLYTISQYTSNYLVDPYLILSIIKAESNFNEYATSKKNAIGLMQLLYTTALEVHDSSNNNYLTIDDLYDSKTNIILGTKYLSYLIKKYNGNYYLAIISYNAGCGNVDKWLQNNIINYNFCYQDIEKIPYNETKKYIKKVINNYKSYKFLYNF